MLSIPHDYLTWGKVSHCGKTMTLITVIVLFFFTDKLFYSQLSDTDYCLSMTNCFFLNFQILGYCLSMTNCFIVNLMILFYYMFKPIDQSI
jgi:hypothetical protein